MNNFLHKSLLSIFLCLFILNFSSAVYSQEDPGTKQETQEDISEGQQLNDAPPALDDIIDKNESQEVSVPTDNSENEAASDDKQSKTAAQTEDEGVVRISKVKIKGAEVVSKQQIEQVIGTEFPSIKFWVKKPVFDEEVLKDDMIRIQRLYSNNGYYDAEATYEIKYNKDGTRVEITINIEEGEPVILTDIELKIEGDLRVDIEKKDRFFLLTATSKPKA